MMSSQRTTSKAVFAPRCLNQIQVNPGPPSTGQVLEIQACSASLSRENLLKFPHLAAIQHNNCMYLAHHLLTLGHHFKAHLPQQYSMGVATFVDLVPGFRKLGNIAVSTASSSVS